MQDPTIVYIVEAVFGNGGEFRNVHAYSGRYAQIQAEDHYRRYQEAWKALGEPITLYLMSFDTDAAQIITKQEA